MERGSGIESTSKMESTKEQKKLRWPCNGTWHGNEKTQKASWKWYLVVE